MTREVAHQKSFEKALYAIENNFPTGTYRTKPTPRRAANRSGGDVGWTVQGLIHGRMRVAAYCQNARCAN